jgi:hypothetical protein
MTNIDITALRDLYAQASRAHQSPNDHYILTGIILAARALGLSHDDLTGSSHGLRMHTRS